MLLILSPIYLMVMLWWLVFIKPNNKATGFQAMYTGIVKDEKTNSWNKEDWLRRQKTDGVGHA